MSIHDRDRDLCVCGDFRHQHDFEGCTICRNVTPARPWEPRCLVFRLAEPFDGAFWRPGKTIAQLKKLRCTGGP